MFLLFNVRKRSYKVGASCSLGFSSVLCLVCFVPCKLQYLNSCSFCESINYLLKKLHVLLLLKLWTPTLVFCFFIILRFRLWQNIRMKILPIYLVYNNYCYLIYMYYYFWQIFAGRPNLFMLFEIIECQPNDMYLKGLFSQLLFICFVTLEWCMGLCCSQNHTSSLAIHKERGLYVLY